MAHTERLQLTMTMPEAIYAMSEGNPGAVNVLARLLREGGSIDRDDVFGGFGSMMTLDTLGLYGWRIWGLFKDVCAEQLHAVIAVLRAFQLGQLEGCTQTAIVQAIESRNNLVGGGATVLDVDRIVKAVAARLPNFTLPAPPPDMTANEENENAT